MVFLGALFICYGSVSASDSEAAFRKKQRTSLIRSALVTTREERASLFNRAVYLCAYRRRTSQLFSTFYAKAYSTDQLEYYNETHITKNYTPQQGKELVEMVFRVRINEAQWHDNFGMIPYKDQSNGDDEHIESIVDKVCADVIGRVGTLAHLGRLDENGFITPMINELVNTTADNSSFIDSFGPPRFLYHYMGSAMYEIVRGRPCLKMIASGSGSDELTKARASIQDRDWLETLKGTCAVYGPGMYFTPMSFDAWGAQAINEVLGRFPEVELQVPVDDLNSQMEDLHPQGIDGLTSSMYLPDGSPYTLDVLTEMCRLMIANKRGGLNQQIVDYFLQETRYMQNTHPPYNPVIPTGHWVVEFNEENSCKGSFEKLSVINVKEDWRLKKLTDTIDKKKL